MNTKYTDIMTAVNRIFGSRSMLRSNIPDDISKWVCATRGIDLSGKIIPVKDAYIILDDGIKDKTIITDFIPVSDVLTKVIIISSNFLNLEVKLVMDIVLDIYKFLMDNNYMYLSRFSTLVKVKRLAPYILTINTFNLVALQFEFEWLIDIQEVRMDSFFKSPEIFKEVLRESMNYGVDELLNYGGILSIKEEVEQRQIED